VITTNGQNVEQYENSALTLVTYKVW